MGIKDIVEEKGNDDKGSIEGGLTLQHLSKVEIEKQRKIREEIEKARYYDKLSFVGS